MGKLEKKEKYAGEKREPGKEDIIQKQARWVESRNRERKKKR